MNMNTAAMVSTKHFIYCTKDAIISSWQAGGHCTQRQLGGSRSLPGIMPHLCPCSKGGSRLPAGFLGSESMKAVRSELGSHHPEMGPWMQPNGHIPNLPTALPSYSLPPLRTSLAPAVFGALRSTLLLALAGVL